MKHMKEMPSFQACDALSTRTDSTRQGDDADSDGSFQEKEGSIWYCALKKWIPNTTPWRNTSPRVRRLQRATAE